MIRIEPRKRKTPEISIAPLIDCMLLLLIFFLLTSSFSDRLGMRISLPGSDSARPVEQRVMEIAVAETGEITFGGRTVGLHDLTAALRAEVEKHGASPVFMVADRSVALETVTEIIDSARAAGVDSVAIAARMKQPASAATGDDNGE